jgi:hypothetical protein
MARPPASLRTGRARRGEGRRILDEDHSVLPLSLTRVVMLQLIGGGSVIQYSDTKWQGKCCAT